MPAAGEPRKKSPRLGPRPRTDSELAIKWEVIADMAKEARAFYQARVSEGLKLDLTLAQKGGGKRSRAGSSSS
jgi:hypothetical protein